MGRRVGTGYRSGSGTNHVGKATARYWAAAIDADRRRNRSATVRRNARVTHRGDWSDPGREDRKQGQAKPPDHHRAERQRTLNRAIEGTFGRWQSEPGHSQPEVVSDPVWVGPAVPTRSPETPPTSLTFSPAPHTVSR